MGTRARRFFARFNRLEFSAPLVEASSGYPELLGQLIDAFTALHPLYGHAVKLPGISLSSLHCCFLSRGVCPSRVCQFKGSFHAKNPSGHHKNLKTAWRKTLKRAGVLYFRIYDLRSTYATRLSAGGVADEWVTQLLRQGDAKVFKKYSQMKLQMKREALEKMNRQANEMLLESGTATIQ